ncbi:MAG TPA: FG-GAP-like repeat-containing protein [Vicinamibacteria bacterium]|nr:FG-GAP-like repeat-containing protein [Vicinamibacteria bacterium]
MTLSRARLLPIGIAVLAVAAHRPLLRAQGNGPGVREAAWRENNLGVALLEQFRFADAVGAFRRALERDPSLLPARINLAIAHLYVPDIPAARKAAEDALRAAPDAPQPNYLLALIARSEGRAEEALPYVRKVLEKDPRDLGANVTLGQVYLQTRQYEEAAAAFRVALAAEPYNVSAAYNLGVALTRSGKREEGQAAMTRFQKLRDSAYKSALGSNYLEQGKYAEAVASTGAEAEAVDPKTPAVTFVEKEDALPGGATLALADLDGDGVYDAVEAGPAGLRLLHGEKDGFRDVTEAAGLAGVVASVAVAGDYDNDGQPDLLVARPGGLSLFRNKGGLRFEDVSAAAGMPAYPFPPSSAAFVDVDHDGDLDIVVAGRTPEAEILLLQNSGNGTFKDVTAAARVGGPGPVVAVVPTDFDNGRDVDLFVLRSDRPVLFKNMRDGSFEDKAAEVGLVAPGPFLSAAVGDVNKDGYMDFFLGAKGRSSLALSDGKGRFTVVPAPEAASGALAAQFLDYDNDGLLDLLVVTAKGPRLLRNLGTSWADVSPAAFPARPRGGTLAAAGLAVADLDGDGDEDALVATPAGLRRLVNEGGNRNRSFTVRLAGRVSNRGGVGAKIDIRAGSLRQKIETQDAVPMPAPADVVFGLGSRAAPDAVRVIWISGIVQTETETGGTAEAGRRAALTVTELDRKPSSCPYLYAWTGERFEFLTDFLGAGEMGYYEAPGVRNSPDPVEYVRIAPGRLVPRDGRYELRVTNELEEVLFLDRLRLLAIDHPADVAVYPDAGMTDPPKAFRLFAVRDPRTPRAIDHAGRDVTARLARLDRVFADDLPLERIRGYAKEHGLTFDLSSVPASHTLLLLTGWTDYAFSSDNVAAHQAGLPSIPPRLEVERADGTWATAVEQVGIPVGRPQTVVVDLAGKLGPSRRARIVTTMRVYWDEAAVAAPAEDVVLEPTALDPVRADLRERGFSAVATGGEPLGFDYARVSWLSPWKAMTGRYTREGDVRPLLAAADDLFVVSKPGDEVAVAFDATALPPAAPGRARTFLLHGEGFSKEMDVNSASPDVVLPLPYHGMRAYPYAEKDVPPSARKAMREAEAWNTRLVMRPLVPIELVAGGTEGR